ncbi:MAG TPA: VanZ family protein [Candidatus Acidoferrum sp.]|jgi:VanZ family protein|nr:VanZ family protein [Candidatus Acidoferrum sp.]
MWMAVVLAMSSSEMSAENTGSILRPLLAWLLPWLRPPHVDLIHALVRKTAHLTEYGILAVLWRRAFVRTEVGRPALAGALAWAVSVVCAIVDETHQSMLPSRTGTASDVVLDSIGALTAILLIQVGRWQAVDTLTGVLLWVAVVGGIGALALDLAAGAGGGMLWLTVPAAAVLLVYRWRRSTSRT